MTGTLELYSDTNAAGSNTVLIDPVNPTSGQTYTLSLFDVAISFTATASTDNNIVTGLKAAIEASANADWQNVTATIVNDAGTADASGDRLLLTYSSASGITRLWRGDAPAVAQVTKVTPGTVTAGDTFNLTINGKELSFEATESTAGNVVDGLIAAIKASGLPEFSDFTTANTNSVLVLTASTAGVPFEVTAGASSGSGVVTVASSQTPQSGTQQEYTFVVPDSVATFYLRYGAKETAQQTTASVTESGLESALDALSTVSNADVTITTESTHRAFTVAFDADSTDDLLACVAYSLEFAVSEVTAGVTGSTSEVQRLTIPSGVAGSPTLTITIDGQTTGAIDASLAAISNTTSAFEDAIESALDALSAFAAGDVTASNSVINANNRTVDLTFANSFGNVDAVTVQWGTEPTDPQVNAVTQTDTGRSALNQKYTVKVDADAGTFTLTAGDQTTSAIAYNAATSAVETALEALSNVDAATVTGSAGDYIVEFAGGLAATAIALTGNGASLTGSGSESLSVSTTTASSGPNHWDTAKNWTPSGVPTDGDEVHFEMGNQDCLYGLDQTSVLLTKLHVSQAYTGKIGLPRINRSGKFFEYRLRDLAIGATQILIGHGSGGGSGKIQINTGADKATVEIRNSGGSAESGIPAVTWRGSHALNEVEVHGGEFGTAMYVDQTSKLSKFTQRGGVASLNNCSLTTVDAPGQTLSIHNCTIDGTIEL